MVFQADGINKMQVGCHNFGRCVIAQHPDKQGNNAFSDERIAVGSEHQKAVLQVAL